MTEPKASAMHHPFETSLKSGVHVGVALLGFWIVFGTMGFSWIEGWPVADGLYMTVITISTVGFGEIHPLSADGRLFASFLILGGLATAAYTFTRIGQVVLDGELLGGLGRRRMRIELAALRDHYVVCGFGRAARPVADGLAEKGASFCVIESDPTAEPILQDRGYPYLIDDATSDRALKDAGVDHARVVLALLPSDANNLYVTVSAKALSPGVRVIARAADESGETKLLRGGADEVISPYALASQPILQAATSPTVLRFMKQVSDRNDLDMNLVEIRVDSGSQLVGESIAAAKLRSKFGVNVVAVRRGDDHMIGNPDPYETLVAGDVLVLIGREECLRDTARALATERHPAA